MTTTFYPKNVCSNRIDIDLEDGIIKSISIAGGCGGNLSGITALVTGKKADEVVDLLRGIDCRGRGTSCPDQISKALSEALKNS